MNKNKIEKNWERLKDKVLEKWDKLTSDDMDSNESQYENLLNKLQEKYEYTKEQATKAVQDWMKEDEEETTSKTPEARGDESLPTEEKDRNIFREEIKKTDQSNEPEIKKRRKAG